MRTHHALGAAVVALALAGCPLNHSSTMSASTSTSASNASQPSASAPSASDDESSTPSSGIHGAIVRRQLETLRGMTPDQATAQLKKFGHDGKVLLGEVIGPGGGGHGYIESCGVNKVCDTSGGSGISVHDDITLFLNPTLTIAPPPP